jgi:hypothetical protein
VARCFRGRGGRARVAVIGDLVFRCDIGIVGPGKLESNKGTADRRLLFLLLHFFFLLGFVIDKLIGISLFVLDGRSGTATASRLCWRFLNWFLGVWCRGRFFGNSSILAATTLTSSLGTRSLIVRGSLSVETD